MVRKISVMDERWDYLIVLDACRYDYFQKLYRDFFKGQLKKVVSQGCTTLAWCKKSFPGRYDDVVYVSANPFINSKLEVEGFNGKNHFHKVIDVWDWGWSEELGTVHPQQVNDAVLICKEKYPGKRFLTHYLQPHEPYLAYKLSTAGFPRPKFSGPQGLQDPSEKTVRICKVLRWGLKLLDKLVRALSKGSGPLGGNPSWRIREILNLPPANPMDSVRRKNGKIGLQQAYIQNLRVVLRYVANLVQNLSGIIIITADHGERLGEWGRYSHWDGISDPFLLEIPWFRVEKGMIGKKVYEDAEKSRIKQRIKELKRC